MVLASHGATATPHPGMVWIPALTLPMLVPRPSSVKESGSRIRREHPRNLEDRELVNENLFQGGDWRLDHM